MCVPTVASIVEITKKYDAFNSLIERKIWYFIDMKVPTRVKTNDVCKR